MTRLEALERVAEAARITAREIGATQSLLDALSDLSALPAPAEATGEVSKIVQISAWQGGIYALTNTGRLFLRSHEYNANWGEKSIPLPRVPEVVGEVVG